jgi:hypothetical protein
MRFFKRNFQSDADTLLVAVHYFSSVVLIEAVAKNLDGRFDVGAFTQPNPIYPGGYSQVAYDEVSLSLDGEELVSRKPFCMKDVGRGPVRFAFYLHFYDDKLPLAGAMVQSHVHRFKIQRDADMPANAGSVSALRLTTLHGSGRR